jgi:hypothetical protein
MTLSAAMPTGPYDLKYADDRNHRTVWLKTVVMGIHDLNIYSDYNNIFCGCNCLYATSKWSESASNL